MCSSHVYLRAEPVIGSYWPIKSPKLNQSPAFQSLGMGRNIIQPIAAEAPRDFELGEGPRD